MREVNDRTALLSIRRREGTRDYEYDDDDDGDDGNGDEENYSCSPTNSLKLKGHSAGKRDVFSAQGRTAIIQTLYRNVFAIVLITGSMLVVGGLLVPLYVVASRLSATPKWLTDRPL